MKKIIFLFIGLVSLFLYSCDPNKEIYDDLDAQRKPYNEAIQYTLTDADYTTMKTLALKLAVTHEDSTLANELGSYKSFSATRDESFFVPLLLAKSFMALDSASTAAVTYKYDYKFKFAAEQKVTIADTLTSTSGIPAIIDSLIPNAVANDYAYVSYKFDNGTAVLNLGAIYQFNGTAWTIPSDSYVLTDADYDAMGTGSGQPGQNNNFSSSVNPDFYLPIFLESKYPYAVAGQTLQLSYKYYSGTTEPYYTKCFFDGTKWSLYEMKTNQFIHNGENWLFDPTVKYTMVKSDFQLIVDWVLANDSLSIYQNGTYTDGEWYFGASAYYGNFDFRDYKHLANDHFGVLAGLDQLGIIEVLLKRLPLAFDILLPQIFPDAQPFSNGIPVYYEIYFKTYTGKYSNYKIKYLCTSVGQFEYVEGPTFIN